MQLCSGGDLAEVGAPALVLGLFLYPLGHEAQAEAFWGGDEVAQLASGGPCSSLLTFVIFLPDSFVINMGDSNTDTSTTVSETVAEEVSLFSMTDMVLFSLIAGFLTYWFLFRKKKDEIPEFTKIQPM